MTDAFRTGVLESADFLKAKNPPFNQYGNLVIDGQKIVAFKGIVERAKACPVGSQVEYNTGPTPDGKGKQLIHIKPVSAQTTGQGAITQNARQTTNWDDRSQRIEFQSMLKIAADKLFSHPATAEMGDDAFRDELFKQGHLTYQRFLKEADSLKNPTQG